MARIEIAQGSLPSKRGTAIVRQKLMSTDVALPHRGARTGRTRGVGLEDRTRSVVAEHGSRVDGTTVKIAARAAQFFVVKSLRSALCPSG